MLIVHPHLTPATAAPRSGPPLRKVVDSVASTAPGRYGSPSTGPVDPVAPTTAASGSEVPATPMGPAPTDPGHRSAPFVGGEGGQATAEYALVLLGAAAVALLLVAWAASSGLIGELFDTVVRQIISRVG